MNKPDKPQIYLPRQWQIPLSAEMKEGTIIKGRIGEIRDFGATLKIKPGLEGFISVPEVSWGNIPINIHQYFKLNQEVEAKIIWLDQEEKRMYLSIKQLTPDPWNKIKEKYPVKSHHIGVVKKLTPYGIFVELEYGIGGMILPSNLSLIKQNSQPAELIKKGQSIKVIILNIDRPNRKLLLGYQ